MDIAEHWQDQGHVVFGREDRLSEGRGITVYDHRDGATDLALHSFYTKFIPYCHEYRVHVMDGKVIDYSKKRRRNGIERSRIRNTANGYIFARTNVELPESVATLAVNAVVGLGLDFGAVDLLNCYDGPYIGQDFILEINTAPGIEGTTLERYVEGFRALLHLR